MGGSRDIQAQDTPGFLGQVVIEVQVSPTVSGQGRTAEEPRPQHGVSSEGINWPLRRVYIVYVPVSLMQCAFV